MVVALKVQHTVHHHMSPVGYRLFMLFLRLFSTTDAQITRSPANGIVIPAGASNGKDKTLVGLSLPRYWWFSSRLSSLSTIRIVTSDGSSPSQAFSAQLWNCASSGTPAPSKAIWKSTVSLFIGCRSSRHQRNRRLPQSAEPAGGAPHPWLQTG